MADLRLAIVGLGKIAHDQHLPAVAATPGISVAAVASRNATLDGVPCFSSIEALLRSKVEVDAVALCTPPMGRHLLAAAALRAGKHVLMEKPPGASVAEIAPLQEMARERGLTLFATWHSRFAPAVEPARALLRDAVIGAVRVNWKEDVRHWHPGQEWIWEPGGLGVFDPGINALSIVTRILPRPLFVRSAVLDFPANRATPIAAGLRMGDATGMEVAVELDWRQTGPQSWDIEVETASGPLVLSGGGKRLVRGDEVLVEEPDREYPEIYRRFVSLIGEGASDVDLSPLVHVADSFMLGERRVVDAFHWS